MATALDLVRDAQENIAKISCDDYNALVESGESHVLLDVREPAEYEAGNITNSVHIPRGVLEFKAEEMLPDKSARIIICCASGGRAALAGETLETLGYSNVSYLDGGYKAYCA